MRAVVLVGGFGTRLRPLTYQTPKPMLPVGHRPIIELVIEQLARGGITEVVLALGFKPEPFLVAFPDGVCAGVPLTYAVEPEPLDTAGAIRYAARFAGVDDTFVVVNGDVLTDLDVAHLVEFHHSNGAEGTLHLTPVDDPSAFGVVAVNALGRVDRFVEKPPPGTEPSKLINAGTYVLEPSVLDRIPGGHPVSIERETFPAMVTDGSLFALATDDYWVDTGRPALYLQANMDVLDGRRRHVRCEPVARDAVVSGEASVRHSLVGQGAHVAAGALVLDSVLLPGAVIEKGAGIVGSVVAGKVEAGASIEACVVGAEGVVMAGAVLRDTRVPEQGE